MVLNFELTVVDLGSGHRASGTRKELYLRRKPRPKAFMSWLPSCMVESSCLDRPCLLAEDSFHAAAAVLSLRAPETAQAAAAARVSALLPRMDADLEDVDSIPV